MPKVKLHSRNVFKLAAPKRGATIWYDSSESAAGSCFGVRVTANGARAYVVRYYLKKGPKKGKRRTATLGSVGDLKLADARKRAREYRSEAREGHDLSIGENTVTKMIEKYLSDEKVKSLRTHGEYKRALEREVVPVLGGLSPEEVKRVHVRALLASIVERGSPFMANRTLGILQACFSWAVRNDLLERAPAWPEPPAEERPRERVLLPEEIRVIWAALETEAERNTIGLAFQLAILTGQRRGEILSMEWSHIVEETDGPAPGWWWTIPATNTKNGKEHRVPLTSLAVIVLNRARDLGRSRDLPGAERWVFPSDRLSKNGEKKKGENHLNQPAHGLARLREACPGVVDFRTHDFRRSFATHSARAGVPEVDIARVLNHTARLSGLTGIPRVTSLHYIQDSYDGPKRLALEAWERRLRAFLAEGEKPQTDNVVPISAGRS
jgi:integrase